MPGLRDMRDLGRGWRMSTVPRSRSAKATHRRAVARCRKAPTAEVTVVADHCGCSAIRENSVQDQPLEPAV
jgi:hypothetical protein